jgi:hypothetical protein
MPGSWYRRKSAECGRMAQAATDPDIRDRFKNEEKLWLQIADGADAFDKALREWEASQPPGHHPK